MPSKIPIDRIRDEYQDKAYRNAVYATAGDDPDMYNLVMVLGINPRVVKLFFESLVTGAYSGRRR